MEDLKKCFVLDFLFLILKDELNYVVKKFFKKGFLWKEVLIRFDGGVIKYIEFLVKRGIGEDFFFVVMRDIFLKKILEWEFFMNE